MPPAEQPGGAASTRSDPIPVAPHVTGELLAGYLAGEREAERRLFERFQGELHERARRHPARGSG